MDKGTFLLLDRIKQIESSFTKDGWLTIYDSHDSSENDQTLIYCCLVDSIRIKKYKLDRNWVIRFGSEGKPSVFESYKDGKTITTYQTYSDKGIEPFLFRKYFSFNDGYDSYVDISEEFILYFKLYERVKTKEDRKFYFIDELGELDEVIIVEPKKIQVKLKYLKEYITIRKMHFSICFDFMRLDKNNLTEMNIELMDKDFQSDYYFYNHLIRPLDFQDKNQSWIHGKLIINPDKIRTKPYHFDIDDSQYATFITGYDNNGNEVLEDCRKENKKLFTLTYFKKEVLDKYYNDPIKYEVDGFHVKSKFFILKIDNNVADYVPVFLVELGTLPYKEQLHWKQYNIPPQKGISRTYYRTMIEGSWAEHPETPDLYFKYKYRSFNEKWEKKFGWKFYKPLAKEDEHLFTALHVPTKNNVKAFCEQMLTIVKVTIDRLNEAEFSKYITPDKNDRGITKLEKFLLTQDADIPDMITFLRKLWDLRSGLLSHSFSNTNKECKKAIEYFGIKSDSYTEVAKETFVKSVITLNTLENRLLNDV
jgi:hypothetical protein